jgi:hypothetical protein
MDRMNLRLLVVIMATTAVLGIMTSSIATGIFSQHANAIMWGLAHCWHNPNVGLICTHGLSGQGDHHKIVTTQQHKIVTTQNSNNTTTQNSNNTK